MNPRISKPPILETDPGTFSSPSRWSGIPVLIVLPVFLFLIRFWCGNDFPLPTCTWKRWTGYPCPGCGSTRSLVALAHFHLFESVYYNPLVAIVLVGIFVVGGINVVSQLTCGKNKIPLRLDSISRNTWYLIAALIVTNWAYLIMFLS